MASVVKMSREDELVYVFNNEVVPAFESDDEKRQGKIYCAALVALSELIERYGYDEMADTLQQFKKLSDEFSDVHQCMGEVGIIHTLIRHDIDSRLISDETLTKARSALKRLVNDYGQDYWKELLDETEMWYRQRSGDNTNNSAQRYKELTFMLEKLVSDSKENATDDPMLSLMMLVVCRELAADHGQKELLKLAERILKALPEQIPPQLLLSAQLKVELTLIGQGYDRPENFSYAAHWCKRLISEYGQNFHGTLESILEDAKKRGYSVDTLQAPQ